MENCKRFIRTLEEKSLSPQTIRLRITALEKFSKWLKKPIELKRPKMKRKLDVNNVPTEEEYNRLLDSLKTKSNKDYSFYQSIGYNRCQFVRIPAVHVGRHYIRGGNTRGKGNKYRRFFLQKQLQEEAKAYAKEHGKTGEFLR